MVEPLAIGRHIDDIVIFPLFPQVRYATVYWLALHHNAGGTAIDQLLYRPNGTANVGALITVCRDKDASTGYLTSIAANGSAALFPRGKSDNSGTALAKCE